MVGALCGCAGPFTETRLAPGATPPVSQARFAEEPKNFHSAFEDLCAGPTDTYSIQSRTTARCRTVVDPETAAMLIVRYDGALEIPYFVAERVTTNSPEGFVVSLSYFATLQLKSGSEQRVYLRSRRFEDTIDNLFRAFGGEPI